MAIFNSYVKLPEGIYIYIIWAHNNNNNNRDCVTHDSNDNTKHNHNTQC